MCLKKWSFILRSTDRVNRTKTMFDFKIFVPKLLSPEEYRHESLTSHWMSCTVRIF